MSRSTSYRFASVDLSIEVPNGLTLRTDVAPTEWSTRACYRIAHRARESGLGRSCQRGSRRTRGFFIPPLDAWAIDSSPSLGRSSLAREARRFILRCS